MYTEFFDKYKNHKLIEKPTNELVEKYKNKLPFEVITFWNLYGFGDFMNGYLKMVNPDEYQCILDEGYHNTNNEIVFAITALGDFLVWVGDAIRLVKFRYGKQDIINSSNIERFFNRRLCDDSFLKIEFKYANYFLAKEKLGELAFDECYGYTPLLGMGGTEKVENLQKVKIKEYISITAQAMGKI